MSDTSDTPRRWPLWLIGSLMANMILVGLLSGLLMQAGPKGTPDRLKQSSPSPMTPTRCGRLSAN